MAARIPFHPSAPAGQEALAAGEVRQLVRQHIASLPLSRWEHIAAFEVLAEPFRRGGVACRRCAVAAMHGCAARRLALPGLAPPEAVLLWGYGGTPW